MGSKEPVPAPNRDETGEIDTTYVKPAPSPPPPKRSVVSYVKLSASGLVVPAPPPEPEVIRGPLELACDGDRKDAARCFTAMLNMMSIRSGGINIDGATEAVRESREEAIRHLARQLLGDVDFEILT